MITDVEKGNYLVSLRDRVKMKQNDLAQAARISAPVLSRIEAGDRAASVDELEAILNAIGTDEARRMKISLDRKWGNIKQPRLGHPDEEILWKTELAYRGLSELSQRGDLKNAFARRLDEYKADMLKTAELLLNTEHQVAFIGCIGVGKSTAICRITDLEIFSEKTPLPTPVLEAGGGGVTLCEVHLRQGPGYGLIIEPRREEEIREDVNDFAEFLKNPGNTMPSDGSESTEGDSLGISREVIRVIRNMSGLTIKREKAPGEKYVRKDLAKELAASCADARSLVVEILAKMSLHKRDRRDIWYSADTGKPPLLWLKEIFEQINNGRHPEFSIPRRIEVVVKKPILENESLSIRLIDTKGIDQTAERADLENLFNETHTVSILCSGFLQAPGPETQQLLQRAINGGTSNLRAKAAIVVLPRPTEALSVKDDLGFAAETVAMGYEIKNEQVEMSLKAVKLPELKIAFFNAREDNPGGLREFILCRIEDLRNSYRDHLNEAISGALALVANYEKEQVQAVQRDIARQLKVWIDNNGQLPPVPAKLPDTLLAALRRAHHSTIHASVRRQGDWWNLDFSHQLSYGARAVANLCISNRSVAFSEITANFLLDAQVSDAHDLVRQAQRIMTSGIEDILRKVELQGLTAYTTGLKADPVLWQACEAEWGTGAGYRDRVHQHNADWFAQATHAVYQEQVYALIVKEWGDLLKRLTPLLEID